MTGKTATNSMITVPKIEVYGVGDLNRIKPFEFDGRIETEIYAFGKSYYELHSDSISLSDEATLFQIYLLSELGENPEIPKDVMYLIHKLFNTQGYGNVTNDACDYDNGKKLRKVKDTDRSVRWINQPAGFERTEEGWRLLLGEDSELYCILVPESGYVELTDNGAYRPDTGTPFSTLKTRKEDERSWIKRGFSQEFAEKAVSCFYSREEGRGTSAVVRWFDYTDNGRFNVGADYGPNGRSLGVGSFLASRSAN